MKAPPLRRKVFIVFDRRLRNLRLFFAFDSKRLQQLRIFAISLIFSLANCIGTAPAPEVDLREGAYIHLNNLRSQAGMTLFLKNAELEMSSGNHAKYLDYHNLVSHNETMGLAYATGVTPYDRAVYAGYPTYYVGENLAIDQNYHTAISSLMAAIYHRFGFLSFDYDEVGTGYAGATFVFNMGHSGIRKLCEGLPATGYVYTGICYPDIAILAPAYNNAIATVRNAQPSYVLWPADGTSGTSPAFFEEIPDPLPAQSVSGYPASVQFNPAVYTTITMQSFTLVDNSTATAVPAVTLMQQANDPNGKFSPLEFAFFPQERLKWNTNYTATFAYAEGPDIVWSYNTKNLGIPIYTVTTSPHTISMSAGSRKFAVYVVPTPANPGIGSIYYSYPASMGVDIFFEDQNTLIFSTIASAGQVLTVKYHNNADQFNIQFK